MAGEEATVPERLDIVGQNGEQEIAASDIDRVLSSVRKNYPSISGLYTDNDLFGLKYTDTRMRFGFDSEKIIQVFNEDYTSNGTHWITMWKERGKRFQIYDSLNNKILTYIPYEVLVKLLSLCKTFDRTLQVEGRGLNLEKYQSVAPPHCTQCEKKIKLHEIEVFLCCICRNVYHETCQPLAFYQNYPACQQCNVKERQKTQPSEHVDVQVTQDKARYLDSLGKEYFVDLSRRDGTTIMFNMGIGTKHEENPYLLHFKETEVLLYDLRYTHHHTVNDYALPHDIEVALVHLSRPHIAQCQQIEILPAVQQDPQSKDCGAYACLSAVNFAAGYTADLLHGKTGKEVRQIFQDFVNEGISPQTLPVLTLGLDCQAKMCSHKDDTKVQEVDMYKCYFCKNWYHRACSPVYDQDCRIYRACCCDCSYILEYISKVKISKVTAQVDTSFPNEPNTARTPAPPSSNTAFSDDYSPPSVTTGISTSTLDEIEEINSVQTLELQNADRSLLDATDSRTAVTNYADTASADLLEGERSEPKLAVTGAIRKEAGSPSHPDTDRDPITEEPDPSDIWINPRHRSYSNIPKKGRWKGKCQIS